MVVLKTLADNGIDMNNCVGQTYDGASVMSGVKNGVAKKIKERAKYAFYTHCFSHRTNLTLVDATKHIKAIGDVMETLNSRTTISVVVSYMRNLTCSKQLARLVVPEYL